MAMTGVTIDDTCQKEFQQMKINKHKRFLVFKIENKKQIVIETHGARELSYADFVKALPSSEPRYAVCDVEYTTKDGQPNAKLVFFHWSPEDSPVREKMLYAASKDAIKQALSGFAKDIQANDNDELDMDEIVKKF